jgi:hypothetical protein
MTGGEAGFEFECELEVVGAGIAKVPPPDTT